MGATTCGPTDLTASVVRKNMSRITLVTVGGPLLCHAAQAARIVRLLQNRRSWGQTASGDAGRTQ